MALTIDQLNIELTANSQTASSAIDGLAESLKRFETALSPIAGALQKINSSLGNFGSKVNSISGAANSTGNAFEELTEKIKGQESELAKLKSDYSSYVLSGQKSSRAAKELEQKIRELSDELSSNKGKLSQAKNAADKLSKSQEKLATSANKAGKSSQSFAQRLAQKISTTRTLVSVFQNAANKMADAFNESNEYIETLNLFNVTMGEGAEKAKAFAENVSALTGIDPKEWMQYQGVFKNLTAGFGVVNEHADIMSQNLTQLSYDLASFFNTDVETAFDKLSSAMSGQVKGLREFGIDTTVASLQEYALSKGIDASVRSMSQAEKSMLRYNYIMEKSIIMQGDMARTIVTPANALRILNAQLTQMKRALGNVVSVLVTQFIPFVQAMVQVITDAANALARLFGFELPEIDYSGLQTGGFVDGVEDAEESLEGASDKIKEIKKQLMGFDELNIINNPDNSSSGGASGGASGGGGSGLNLEPIEYDFLKGIKTENLDKIKDTLGQILQDAANIGLAIAGWDILKFANQVKNYAPSIGTFLTKLAGITISVAGFSLEFSGAVEIGNGTAGLWDYLKTALGAALGIAGALITFGTGPVGWGIGIATALTIFLTGYAVGYNKKKMREDLEARFGEVALTAEEIKQYVEKLTTSDFTIRLGLYVDANKELEQIKGNLETSLKELQKYNFKIKLGLEVTQESYMAAIDDYIAQATDYLTQQQITSTIALDVLFGESALDGGKLQIFSESFYKEQQEKLAELGAKLKKAVSESFVEGKWIEDKWQEAMDLQTEIQEVLAIVSQAEYKAKLTAVGLDYSSLDMDAASFQQMVADVEATIEEQVKNLEGVRLEGLKVAQMQFDKNLLNGKTYEEAAAIYNSTVSAIQQEFANGIIEINSYAFEVNVDKLQGAFATELEKAVPVLGMTVSDAFSEGLIRGARNLDEVYAGDVEMLVLDLQKAYEEKMDELNMSSAAEKNLAEMLEALRPSQEQLRAVAEQYYKAGEAVPENVAQGLRDFAQLEALAGSLKGQSYLIGEMLSTDASFVNLLATAEGAGKGINEETARGLMTNLQFVKNAAENTITIIGDEIGSKTYEITPTLIENMKDMGINLTDGIFQGIELEHEKKKGFWETICGWFGKSFEDENEIHSPSKLFERYGGNIIQGLKNGLTSAWNGLKSWWEGLSLKSPSIKMPHFTWTTTPASGWMADVLSAIGLPTSLPKLNVSWYASGGFPSMGEMFIAREGGPELVGTIGNKTAVANNDQIVAGIEGGVYRAMVAANATKQGGTQTIRIINEIDGDVVGEKVIQYHNGKVLQTGVSPLMV